MSLNANDKKELKREAFSITSREERRMFKTGLGAMLDVIQPKIVLVHGYMPDEIFGEYVGQVEFHRYASQFERTHLKEGA